MRRFFFIIFFYYICNMKTNRTTPNWLSYMMWSIVADHVRELTIIDIKILEPSAGEGGLLKPSWESEWLFNNADITCVELNKEKCEILKQHEKQLNVIHADFLNYNFTDKYDVIIAAPPFNNNVDVDHIQKMFSLLNPNGIIVSLTTPYWMTNNESHQVEFRKWLDGEYHSFKMLPDMTFIEKSKTVPTGILIIKK